MKWLQKYGKLLKDPNIKVSSQLRVEIKQNHNNWDVQTMDTEDNKPIWKTKREAKIRAKLFGYSDEPGVIIGEYMAIDHKRLLQIMNEKPDNSNN